MTSDHGRLPTLALWEQNVPKCLPLSHGYPYSHGFATGRAQTILMPCLSFLGPNEINCLYCADPPLFILPCSDMYENMTAMFAVAGFNLCCSLTPLSSSSPPTFLFSQPFCVTALMKGGPRLSPALGPICRLSLFFYGMPFCIYRRPPSEASVEQGKMLAVFYIFVSPLLNLLVYI